MRQKFMGVLCGVGLVVLGICLWLGHRVWAHGGLLSPKPSPRIVVLLPVYLPIVAAYGETAHVVGVPNEAARTALWQHAAQTGASLAPSLPTLFALRPTLVLGAPVSMSTQLEPLHTDVVPGAPLIHNRSELYQLYRNVGIHLGKSSRDIDALLQHMEAEWDLLQRQPLATPAPRVAWVFAAGPDSFYVLGTDSLEHELLVVAHAQNVLDGPSTQTALSARELASLQPEWILTDAAHVSVLENHPALQKVPAVRNHHVLGVPTSDVFSPHRARVACAWGQAWHQAEDPFRTFCQSRAW